MSRALLAVVVIAVVSTAATISLHHLVDTDAGLPKFWGDLAWSTSIASLLASFVGWLGSHLAGQIMAMMKALRAEVGTLRGDLQVVSLDLQELREEAEGWRADVKKRMKTLDQINEHLSTVEQVVAEIDEARVQADTVVKSLFGRNNGHTMRTSN